MLEVFRKEIKYGVSMVDFCRMRPLLSACLTLDPHCTGGNGYLVRSLYFDSLNDDDLLDVLSGLKNKQKIRLRCYGPEETELKLEYKCKSGTDSIKRSIAVSRRETEALLRGRLDGLSKLPGETAKELYARMKLGAYVPRVVVEYRRIAYLSRLNDVRITFDYDVRASFDPATLLEKIPAMEPVSPPGWGTLEVKYNGFLPGYIQTALSGLNGSPEANSKYAQSRLLL